MGTFTDAIKAFSTSSSDTSALSAALDAALAAKDVADVRSAMSAACNHHEDDPYCSALFGFLEAAHGKIVAALPLGTSSSSSSSPNSSNTNNTIDAMLVLAVKEALAEFYVIGRQEMQKGVQILQPFVSPRQGQGISDAMAIRATVKMIELFIYAEEFGQAETLMPRCAKYMKYNNGANDELSNGGGSSAAVEEVIRRDAAQLRTRFVCSQAQLHESKRRFLDAAQRFYEVSLNDPEQATVALQSAVSCTIMADPSEARFRLVSTLLNDERTSKALGAAMVAILMKISQMRFLRVNEAAEVKAFVTEVNAAHTTAPSPSTPSTLDAALLTHNVRAVSQVYYNIGITELATLVGVSPDDALHVVASMISAGKINGSIDQVGDIITFHGSRDDASTRNDAQIAAACNTVANAYEAIKLSHPHLAVV